ncbi:MAG: TonB-dependent receptor [Firmicutes bacterium]|nr:TonB-dependent receptor [Bacillota bacterium]
MPRYNRVCTLITDFLLCCNFFFIAALLLSLPAHADPDRQLAGHVHDPHGLPILGAEVRLLAANKPVVVRQTRTETDGRFTFTNLDAESYQLVIVAPGFRRYQQSVTTTLATPLEITLELAGLQEGVLVTAERNETETFAATLPAAIVPDRLLARQLAINLAQALEEIPGVQWRNAGAFRARPVIRGLDSNRVLVLVDGERLNNGRTSTQDAGIETSLVDLGQIEQVEVVRGPGSVLYGSDAFGGVVNILTHAARPAETLRFGLDAGGDFVPNANGRRGHLGLWAGSRHWSARAQGGVGEFENYQSPAGTVFGSGVRENSGMAEWRWFPRPLQSLYFKFLYRGGYDFGLPTLEPNPNFLATFPFSRLRKWSWGYNGSFTGAALSSLQARFYAQRQNRDFFNQVRSGPSLLQSETVTDVHSFGYDFQLSSIPNPRIVLTYGSSFFRDRNRDHREQILNPGLPGERLLSAAPSVPNSTFSGLGFFLHNQIQVLPPVRVVAGVRADRFALRAQPTPNFNAEAFARIRERTDSALGGNLGATVQLQPGWVVTANLARAFREPNLFERFFFGRGSVGGFVVPNPDLKPETSVQWDVGTRLQSGPLRLAFNYFRNSLRDLISRAPATFNGQSVIAGQPVVQNVNLEAARIEGLESSAELFLRGLGVQWNPFFTLAWQRGTNRSSGAPLPLIAPVHGQAGLRWQPLRRRLWSELRARFVTSSQRVPAGQSPIAAFTVFGWRAGYELVREETPARFLLPPGFRSVHLNLAVENLGNRLYQNLFETVPEPGRSFRFGVRFDLDTGTG